ncbi:MAG: hypothetical protein ACLFP8_00975 [Alphaproteobacteria bacterium]
MANNTGGRAVSDFEAAANKAAQQFMRTTKMSAHAQLQPDGWVIKAPQGSGGLSEVHVKEGNDIFTFPVCGS